MQSPSNTIQRAWHRIGNRIRKAIQPVPNAYEDEAQTIGGRKTHGDKSDGFYRKARPPATYNQILPSRGVFDESVTSSQAIYFQYRLSLVAQAVKPVLSSSSPTSKQDSTGLTACATKLVEVTDRSIRLRRWPGWSVTSLRGGAGNLACSRLSRRLLRPALLPVWSKSRQDCRLQPGLAAPPPTGAAKSHRLFNPASAGGPAGL